MRATFAVLGACTLLAISLLSGCGSNEPHVVAPTPAEARRALAGSPPPLAALHRQAAALLGGGERAYEERLAALRGRPVVVNAWASWCDPCEREMPLFQRAAVRFGRRVAFLGINPRDARPAARAFLREHWVPYPSYEDPDERIARAIGVRTGLPTTVFYDRAGEVAFVHQGQYRDERQLADDVERYAIGSA
jgi:cytochrome c biogenesis protein CcmG, thiol:disulfide interchange protein DsbE